MPVLLSFSHPDYTVGSGLTPDQPRPTSACVLASQSSMRVTDLARPCKKEPSITVGRDFHPAPKEKNYLCFLHRITRLSKKQCLAKYVEPVRLTYKCGNKREMPGTAHSTSS